MMHKKLIQLSKSEISDEKRVFRDRQGKLTLILWRLKKLMSALTDSSLVKVVVELTSYSCRRHVRYPLGIDFIYLSLH